MNNELLEYIHKVIYEILNKCNSLQSDAFKLAILSEDIGKYLTSLIRKGVLIILVVCLMFYLHILHMLTQILDKL